MLSLESRAVNCRHCNKIFCLFCLFYTIFKFSFTCFPRMFMLLLKKITGDIYMDNIAADRTNEAKIIKQNAKLLDLLRFYKDIDKSELSRRLQVSLPTVYKSIDDLTTIGIINKSDSTFSINNNYGILVGISIGSSLCKVVFLNLDFQRFTSDKFDIHKKGLCKNIASHLSNTKLLQQCLEDCSRNYIYFDTPSCFSELKNILNDIFDYIQSCILNHEFHVLSIGISCTGINDRTQSIMSAHNLHYLDAKLLATLIFPDKQQFFQNYGIHLSLVQNSNASLIAEKVHLCLTNSNYQDKENIISLYFGKGWGAGFYFNKLYTGIHGYAGEIGHIKAPCYESNVDILEYNNRLAHPEKYDYNVDDCCTCGNNDCYDFKIRSYCFNCSAKDFQNFSSDEIRDYLASNPQKAQLLGKYLGNMINTLTNLLNVELIVFTGKIYKSMELLNNYIEIERDENPIIYSRTDCTTITSSYGSLAPSIGAAIYAYHTKYDLELSWSTNPTILK